MSGPEAGEPAGISVVICAHTADRWNELQAAVASVGRQTVAPTDLVVVIDHDAALLERARGAFGHAVVVPNAEGKGLSGARNTGVAAARGALVAFLDDDAVADEAWLEELAQGCRDPQVLGASSRIEPDWHAGRPRWFPQEFLWVVGCSYKGLPEGPAPVRNVLGAGMAIKRPVLERVGGFSSLMGRRGGRLPLSCDETELCLRAQAAFPEGRFVQVPTARCRHTVPPSRGRLGYFALRCYAEGISKAHLAMSVGSRDPLSTERRYVLGPLVNAVFQGLGDTLRGRDAAGVLRSAAIGLGLASAMTGYALAKLSRLGPGRSA